MDPERRGTDRRHDPDAWSPQHKHQVDTVWGMAVGGGLIVAAITLLFWAIVNDRVEPVILGACVFVLVMGLVAGRPKVFMPIFSALLKRVPLLNRGANGSANGSITQAIERLELEDKTD